MKKFKFEYEKAFIGVVLLFICNTFMLSAESSGETAFKENRPEDASILLEEDIKNGTASPSAYNYLGLSYYQLGEYEKSVEAFKKGLNVSGTNKKLLSFNQGNSYYAMGKYNDALKSYTLALSADQTFYKALLNKANAELMLSDFENAKNDYKKYITVVPDDPQRPEIEKLIDALGAEIVRQEKEAEEAALEAERLAEEEKRMAEEMEKQRLLEEERLAKEKAEREAAEAEQKRIEEEQRAAEAERRRKLLEDVANSLHNTDSTNMSSGTDDLIDYEQEAELD